MFYPTSVRVAALMVSIIDWSRELRVLEPSAGEGDLLALFPKGQGHSITCFEIDKTRRAILRSKGWKPFCDFFKMPQVECFDVVLMNPPFPEHAYIRHILRAMGCLVDGGQLVALIPEEDTYFDSYPGVQAYALAQGRRTHKGAVRTKIIKYRKESK